jgi:pyruvate/2-oxoglutarate dehydrogenase complex dihydrolipoamide dehydrogenase (E3) component
MCAADRDEWDVVVIGGGPPGEVVAQYASQYSGLSTVLIEQERVGGECQFWACRPSKALLMPVTLMTHSGSLPGMREAVQGRPLDLPAVLHRRDVIATNYDDGGEVTWLHDHGIDLLRGHGRLTGPRAVSVTSADGAVRDITARHAVVLSPGTSALVPPIDGLAAAKPWTSRDVTGLHELPRRVAVVGAGPVACESATWLRGLGADVTLVVRGGAFLSGMEPFVSDIVLRGFQRAGVDVRFRTTLATVSRPDARDTGTGWMHGGPLTLELSDSTRLEVDELVIATGRRANSDDLGLDTVGVRTSHGFVDVDEHMGVAGVEWLYAIGDLTGRALLTHMGKYEARIAGEVIVARAQGRPLTASPATTANFDAVPQVVFIDPQVTSVGLTEAQARDRGIDVQTAEYDIAAVSGGEIERENYDGRAKMVVDRASDTLVGVTFVGGSVAELLHSATIAVVGKVPITALWHAVPSFPTISEVWLRLLETLDQQRRKG